MWMRKYAYMMYDLVEDVVYRCFLLLFVFGG
jgi:hypothetical protein